jgi:hypothetical protein
MMKKQIEEDDEAESKGLDKREYEKADSRR